jgi:hypothetical protein
MEIIVEVHPKTKSSANQRTIEISAEVTLSTIGKLWNRSKWPMATNEWVLQYTIIYSIIHHKEKWHYVLCRKMDGTGDYHVEWDNPSSKKWNVTCFCSYVVSRPKMVIMGPGYKRRTVWNQWEGDGKRRGTQ